MYRVRGLRGRFAAQRLRHGRRDRLRLQRGHEAGLFTKNGHLIASEEVRWIDGATTNERQFFMSDTLDLMTLEKTIQNTFVDLVLVDERRQPRQHRLEWTCSEYNFFLNQKQKAKAKTKRWRACCMW